MPPNSTLLLSSLQKLPRLRLRNSILNCSAPPSPSRSRAFGSLCLPTPTTSTKTTCRGAICDTRPQQPPQNRRFFATGADRQGRNVVLLGQEVGVERITDEMADRIHRVTMFKIADEGQQKQLIEQYKILGGSHKKDGKPYILSMVVGPAVDDPRAQGFTIVAKTEFASLEDMKYYDDECAAHGVLKSFVKGNLTVGGVMSVYFKPEAVAVL
ncbi:stress responsive A/B Barrel domain-containing protein [Colletotrichum scovillei]|uniref:Stress responsive A/B Barrel domain-containing protein n=1 Tax=Colletotrichum scovillei TaxID=1209932 RepID=A0A9P7UKP3_9PEZI|nr:stress responsive A/B Barrel domain-containing protein [Colletotrichum scovillei]KAF4779137.1 stress responsive A/B Barrel domain-containing protein [Colletotrichum scovillei]KAG7058328.1 stress responsive A/B Barrel domain-containing protein [Colletotrichum scovillei]KAG7076929.1 stress responsive A/B Barrel domain-containing protein [Colletotrichum scovillei]KAG7084043.1 stress responsive A/B Barrel domain-containing protein [Colletotrichum scovillei]